MRNREATGKTDERVLLESSRNHYLRPASSLIGRLCHVSLTRERLIFREAGYDLTSGTSYDAVRMVHDVVIDAIEHIRPGGDTDEPSIEFDVRNDRKQLEKLILWFRDDGWIAGRPERLAERDGWIAAINRERRRRGVTSATPTRGDAPIRSASTVAVRSPITTVLAGTYQVVRQIGAGGMGVVYLGRDRKLNRPVAIKKLRRDIGLNGREKSVFLQEARLSAALHHPFIVDIYAIIEEGAEIYLVFEYVDGQTLLEHVHEHGPMDAAALSGPLENICAALSYAHSRHVVHRDLKPSNIMLTSHGYAKVMDFGIARQVKDTASRLSAGSVDTSGTVPYMAPEQELGRFDIRSDIFSLGVTLYELLTGDLPFSGPNFYLQKEHGAVRPLADAAPETPGPLASGVERCLRFDANERFQSIDEFARHVGVN